jgi:hypothetical protein
MEHSMGLGAGILLLPTWTPLAFPGEHQIFLAALMQLPAPQSMKTRRQWNQF